MHHWIALALFLIVSVGIGSAIGIATAPGPWYAALIKPVFTPPGWIFAPVWTVLYILIAVAGWRTWRRCGTGTAFRLWVAQLLVNFAWSPAFFTLHSVGLALVLILALLALILAFITATWRNDKASAWMFVPYAAWVAFASVLNTAIWLAN